MDLLHKGLGLQQQLVLPVLTCVVIAGFLNLVVPDDTHVLRDPVFRTHFLHKTVITEKQNTAAGHCTRGSVHFAQTIPRCLY